MMVKPEKKRIVLRILVPIYMPENCRLQMVIEGRV